MNAQGVLNAQIAWQLQSCPERQSWWPPKGLNLLCGIKPPHRKGCQVMGRIPTLRLMEPPGPKGGREDSASLKALGFSSD
jgi:hypothetical protein